jgi:hypothetical protein
MGATLSYLREIKDKFVKSKIIITRCPYCNIYYGKRTSKHMTECPFRKKRPSLESLLPESGYTNI